MRKVIRTNGTEELIVGIQSMDVLRLLICAEALDIVSLRDGVHVMLVDDLGYSKNLPVNAKATELYLQKCIPGTTHRIVGDVVIVPDEDFATM